MAPLPLTLMKIEEERGRRRPKELLVPVAFASGQCLDLDLHLASNIKNHTCHRRDARRILK